MPRDLRIFYGVHNGFGPYGSGQQMWWANHVQPDRWLSTLGEVMNPIQERQGIVFPCDFDDLLEFFPDGAGNAQCFYRHNHTSDDLLTVDWDHETMEISLEEPFFAFIDERLNYFDEE